MEYNDESLKVDVSLEEQQRVNELIKTIVTEKKYTEDWTYAAGNIKNREFREKYICGEEEYRHVLSKLHPAVFLEAEKNNSPKARRDSKAAKEIMYKYIVKETFALRDPQDIEEELIDIYVKVTFPNGIEDGLIIVSFHESIRSLESELENKLKTHGQH